MRLARARAIVDDVVTNAPAPVSVFVADAHGELVAAATMDGAAPDTRLNAQRKAYTAARSDASPSSGNHTVSGSPTTTSSSGPMKGRARKSESHSPSGCSCTA